MIKIYNRLYNTLGICQKAGRLTLGTAAVEAQIINKRAKLVLLSSRLSERTIKKFKQLCTENNVKVFIIDDNGCLGKSIGRDDIKIMAITDYNFKKMVCEVYNQESGVSNECQRK